MLCQNCNDRDAAVHIRRIINGEACELRLCRDCAKLLGISGGAEAELASLLAGSVYRGSGAERCENCGFSLEDIARSGKPGCPDCYIIFGDKLKPMLRKIHGRAEYKGNLGNK